MQCLQPTSGSARSSTVDGSPKENQILLLQLLRVVALDSDKALNSSNLRSSESLSSPCILLAHCCSTVEKLVAHLHDDVVVEFHIVIVATNQLVLH